MLNTSMQRLAAKELTTLFSVGGVIRVFARF